MKTLKTSFANQKCCYYDNEKATIDFNSFTDKECIAFIEEYFKAGEKEKIIKEEIIKKKIINAFEKFPKRASHSVSAYMIGLLAYQAHQIRIDTQLARVSIEDFHHIWFLICLYHDYGYYLEESPNLLKKILYKQISSNIRALDPKHWGDRYNPDLIEAYFKLRRKKEHGTIAGVLLRKRLNENLEYAISQNQGQDSNDFIWRNLHWSKGHKEWYDFAASLIIKHNIWFANSEVDSSDQDDENKQKNNQAIAKYRGNSKLERLIIDNSERMTFDENPLLFILYMIDTIEPVKIGQNINLQESTHVTNGMILDIVSLQFIDNNLIIDIEESSCYHRILHDEIFSRAKHMETWMQIKVFKTKQTNILRTTIQW